MKNQNLASSVGSNLIGIFGTFLGLIMFAVSLYLYLTPIDKADREQDITEKTIACVKYANGFHNTQYALNENSIYEARLRGQEVIIRKENIVSGKDELLEIENIIANCKNMVLTELCIGQVETNPEFSSYGCQNNGLNVKLLYKENWTYNPVF